ncbi:MAG: universal stress protein [Chloroflexales bacterium]
MFHTILVPLDGSPASEQALAAAARLAQNHQVALHIAHVHSPYTTTPITIEGMPVIDEELHSRAADHELAYLRQVAASVNTAVAPVVARLDGPVAFTLSSYCQEIHANLLVLTTHGRSGFSQLWLGNVAEALLHSLGVPMLLLRPTPVTIAPAPFRHILVPLDGSALAEQILPHAMAIASHDGAKLTLLRVVEGHSSPDSGRSPLYRPHEMNVADQRATADFYLSRLAAELLTAGYAAHTSVVAAEHPARAILTTAEECGADMIALATRGRSGSTRSILGSVADKLIRGGTLPMLALRPSLPGN